MQLLSLTLKGFHGIRDGLGLSELTLDFEALCDDAKLVAITGVNGRGKSTVLDNCHPYLTMPSRASIAGPGGFKYYEHVYLPENEKDLIWALDGRCYRSQVVIRLGGRRHTDAYLFELSDAGNWRPVKLDDGTLSDGKVETYNRCVERLCGSADTFFTSAFGAQGKRHLCDYRNAEIKTLLADLLGQEAIQALGRKASETAKLLKAGLAAVRQEIAAMDAEESRLALAVAAVADAPARSERAEAALHQATATLDAAREAMIQLQGRQTQCRDADARREQLQTEREAAQAAARIAIQELDEQEQQERQRLDRLDQRIAQQAVQAAQRRQRLQGERTQGLALLARAPAIERATRRLALAEQCLRLRTTRLAACRQNQSKLEQAQAKLRLLTQRLQGIEREAGQAALQAQSLAQRFGLTAQVPCSGTPLQGRCQLLGDARQAQAMIPSAQAVLSRLASEKDAVAREIDTVRACVRTWASADQLAAVAQQRLDRARESVSRYGLLAAKAGEMQAARQRLTLVQAELSALETAGGSEGQAAEQQERQAIAAALQAIEERRARQSEQLVQTLARLDAVLATLPPPFDRRSLADAQAARDGAITAHVSAQKVHQDALRQAYLLAAASQQEASLAARRASAARRAARIESAVGDWTLLARCMSNDGLIALAIDDAGPALSALANNLLRACYGPRFTVSILTQSETATGGLREDFDILVHDAESGASKSVRLMSGGERVWVNEALVRAVALYLAQVSQRRYGTLLSDEADGALDPARKRMFGAMKRQVLRLGGYQREIFISQTPELAGMADAVIDLDAFKADGWRL